MPAPRLLIISEQVWRLTTLLLTDYANAKVEAGIFWFGIRLPEVALASVVAIPRQTNRSRSFDVRAEDLAQLVQSAPDDLVVVGQLHTHPGLGTQHSPWDDERVVSQKILSVVLPRYGTKPRLDEAGVHEYFDGQWRLLSGAQVNSRISVVAALVDTR